MKTFSKVPGNEKLKELKCLYCCELTFRDFFVFENYKFVKCRNCGLVFQNPMPEPKALSERYDEEYFDYEIKNEENFFNLMRMGLEDVNFFNNIEPALKVKSFLDIGCATGLLLELMKKRSWRVKGVEPCASAAAYGVKNRNIDIVNSVFEDADLSEGSYSVIHCSHVIEHVTDPGAFLQKVNKLLLPGGFFVVTTPNISGFQAFLYGKKWRSAIPDHMVLFSYNNLKKFAFKYGFSLLRSKTWGGLAQGSRFKYLKKPLDRMAKWFGFGDVMIFLLKKKA